MSVFLLVALLLVLLLLGTPLFVVMGASVSLLIVSEGYASMTLVAQKMIDELNNDLLMSLPFFGMAAVFMQRGGVAKTLVDLATALLGWMRGGLGLVAVGACTIFASISGSSVTTALAMGVILVPPMLAKGYRRDFTAGLLGAGGTLGILIPPSLPLILYAILAEQSLPRLFLAALIPGLLQALLMALYVMYVARRHDLPAEPPMPRADILTALVKALPALSVPAIIAVGIYGGLLTVTESAVATAFVALFLSVFVYRGIAVSAVLPVMGDAISTVAAIIFIIMTAMVFGHWVTESGVPMRLVAWLDARGLESWQFIFAIIVVLLVLGMFLEIASILLILVPILIPVLHLYDINPVRFGIVMMVAMEIAAITPPVGLNLFVLSSISRAPVAEVIRGIWPFVILMAGLLLFIAYVPAVSMWLPTLIYGS